jgi:Ca2+-binding EF-hand superfamily protein
MGGGASQPQPDASDILTLNQAKSEIVKYRTFCQNHFDENAEMRSSLDEPSIRIALSHEDSRKDILVQRTRPLDASDIDNLESAKAEVIRLRSIWISMSALALDSVKTPDSVAAGQSQIVRNLQKVYQDKDLVSVFKEYDKDRSGLIDRSELRRFLRMSGVEYNDDDFENLFSNYDLNGDGKFAYGEFIHFCSQESAELLLSRADSIRSAINTRIQSTKGSTTDRAFEDIDRDKSGLVDRGEMRRLLRVHNIPHTEEQFEAIFLAHDFSGDGKLDYSEFLNAITHANKE